MRRYKPQNMTWRSERIPMTEIINFRNVLMNELDHGFFDRDAWGALVVMARDANCHSIAAQAERYYNHYSGITAGIPASN